MSGWKKRLFLAAGLPNDLLTKPALTACRQRTWHYMPAIRKRAAAAQRCKGPSLRWRGTANNPRGCDTRR
jgi:hypothetical protein